MRRVGVLLVHVYRYTLRPVLDVLDPVAGGRRCKYEPTCSRYAIEAFGRFGLLRGGLLAAWRLVRCNPWSHGGVDHVHEQRLFRPRGARGRSA